MTSKYNNSYVIQEQANAIFGTAQFIEGSKCVQLVQKILLLPGYFAALLIKKYGKIDKKISKQEFYTYWK